MFKRAIAVILTAVCISASLTACKNKSEEELHTLENTPIQVQTNKTDFDIPIPEELRYDVDFDEYITLPDITALELSYHTMSTDDTSVNNQIYNVQLQKAERTEITDRAAAEGDVVTVNYKSVFYGTDEQISDQQNVEISLGKHIAIPALEDAIIGMSTAETKTADIVYPEDYTGNTVLANSKATFTIELVKIETAVLPELTEDFIKSLPFGVSTYEELRAYILDWMKQENELYKQDALYNALMKDAQLIAMPPNEYNFYLERFDANSTATGQSAGVSLDEYIAANYESREKYEEERAAYAQDNVKNDLVIHALKERYNVEVTKEEYNTALNGVFEEEAEGLGISTVEDFHDKMGESVYKMELTYQVISAAYKDAPDKK